mmetsp:Transcript_265/g.339  ORF Transcript_265/g.339 Transcript_265/m.339 type:complete len:81 (+) Transcript_265:194-436(+)
MGNAMTATMPTNASNPITVTYLHNLPRNHSVTKKDSIPTNTTSADDFGTWIEFKVNIATTNPSPNQNVYDHVTSGKSRPL